MADVITREQRRKNIQAIKSISKLESIVSKALWKKGFRFRRNSKDLLGKPDISIKKYQIVIFIDSCFWHQCPFHANMPKTNTDYRRNKLGRNIKRDKEVNEHYISIDWNIKRVWEHEVKNDLDKVVEDLAAFIRKIQTQ